VFLRPSDSFFFIGNRFLPLPFISLTCPPNLRSEGAILSRIISEMGSSPRRPHPPIFAFPTFFFSEVSVVQPRVNPPSPFPRDSLSSRFCFLYDWGCSMASLVPFQLMDHPFGWTFDLSRPLSLEVILLGLEKCLLKEPPALLFEGVCFSFFPSRPPPPPPQCVFTDVIS